MSVLNNLICPLDQLPLLSSENALYCSAGHHFDLAKSGYINLLPVQKKRSKDPGDSKDMVQARHQFLQTGKFLPIVDQIVSLIRKNADIPSVVFDAGCGEGYYLDQLRHQLGPDMASVDWLGLDISKWAIQKAAKRSKDIGWVVGSNARIPKADGCISVILCLFGFPVFEEFHRVLEDDGYLIMVDTGPDHLLELRQILYPQLTPFRDPLPDNIPGFELLESERLTFEFALESQEQLQQLLAMTPHNHKAPYDGREAAKKIDFLETKADVLVRCLQKSSLIRGEERENV